MTPNRQKKRLAAMKTTSLSMCSALMPCSYRPAQEKIGVLDLHSSGDAPLPPVLDALGTASGLVKAEGLGQFGRATERLDQLGVGVEGVGDVHDPELNVTFKQKSNAAFNNAVFSLGRIHRMSDSLMHPSMERLYQAARELKDVVGQSAVGRLLNASPQTIKNWESRGVSKTGAITAQEIVGCSATWVLEGTGLMTAMFREPDAVSNIEPVERKKRVPLISWVRAGLWNDVQDPFHPGEADDWAEAYDTRPGDNAFALRVIGDSMTNPVPGDRTFPEGTIIIVDPGRSADAGDYVVAKDIGTQKATFKRLVSDGGRWYLKPLNPAYPTVEIDDPNIRVIGKVIEYQTRGKL